MKHNPIICAIDTKDFRNATNIALKVKDNVGLIKLGLEFFCANGSDAIRKISKDLNIPIFLDLKLHDIPNTVAKSLEALLKLDVSMTTLHLLGGKEMLKRAVQAKQKAESNTKLLGVSILTSHDDITEIGIQKPINDQVLFLAENAAECGLDGIVCSPLEANQIKQRFGDALELIVPGIRPEANISTSLKNDDQSRILTPKQAIEQGADYIVIGRPITQSQNPQQISAQIRDSLK